MKNLMPQIFPMSWVMIYLFVLGLFLIISLIVRYQEDFEGGKVVDGGLESLKGAWLW